MNFLVAKNDRFGSGGNLEQLQKWSVADNLDHGNLDDGNINKVLTTVFIKDQDKLNLIICLGFIQFLPRTYTHRKWSKVTQN